MSTHIGHAARQLLHGLGHIFYLLIGIVGIAFFAIFGNDDDDGW